MSRPYKASDPGWADETAPLLAFLSVPRTWGALEMWSAEQKVDSERLHDQLAWLTLQSSAEYDHNTQTWGILHAARSLAESRAEAVIRRHHKDRSEEADE